MTGDLTTTDVARMRASDGTLLSDALTSAGFDPAAVPEATRQRGEIGAYFELHIEQGPVLEARGLTIGVVEAIAGQERLSVRFTGAPDHAGTTPMDMRRDAFAAAARFADRFRDHILAEGGAPTRGTIGIVKVLPNAGNVVPSEVRLGLEIRDIDAARLARLADGVTALAGETAAAMDVRAEVRKVYGAAPVPMSAALSGLLAAAARDLGHSPLSMPSGAGHDAAIMAAVAPAAMIFVPSIGGRSHCPEEQTDWSDIVAGVAVLEEALRRQSAMPLPERLSRCGERD
jgi:hydantoinase/carbamoylase family amidase